MAARGSRREDDTAQDDWDETDQPDSGESERDRPRQTRQLARTGDRRSAARQRPMPGAVFDPRGAIRVGLLRLARNWKDSGSIYQAIHTYTEVLVRYPDTGAANVAVEELLDMADSLAQQGRHYAALNIFNKLEQLY